MKKENTRWLHYLIKKATHTKGKRLAFLKYFGHEVTIYDSSYIIPVTHICIDNKMGIYIDYELQKVGFEDTPDSYIESILNSLKVLYPSFTWEYEACYYEEAPAENAKVWENHQILRAI